MGVAFGTRDIVASHKQMQQSGINTGTIRSLTRNFEHPDGWTHPSFRLCAPADADIEGLMHVVVIEHLTPELIRQPQFLIHANSCTGVASMSGVIYDAPRVAGKMRALFGDDAVAENADGVRVTYPTGQRLELLRRDTYEDRYGGIADSPDPDTPRLGTMTLHVASKKTLTQVLESSGVPYSDGGIIRVEAEHACGATLLFAELAPDWNPVAGTAIRASGMTNRGSGCSPGGGGVGAGSGAASSGGGSAASIGGADTSGGGASKA